jgi:hypothetical protein
VGEVSTVAEKLREARALIAKGWTQGEFARTKTGRKTPPKSPSATCFCASGAVIRATGAAGVAEGLFSQEFRVLRQAVRGNVVIWNDAPERTQAEVLQAFDRAIELAESQA